MHVLMVHNRYQQPGGEDAVFAAEIALLRAHGHRVTPLLFDNREIPARRSPLGAARLAVGTVWSQAGAARVREAIRADRPDVVHFHNTFPLVSPAAYHAARAEGVPVVQTLHNYRLLCPSATFYRDGRVCEDCLGRAVAWPAVRHACYHGSRAETGAIAGMLATHRLLGTWARAVDVYIALSEFARGKFLAGGFPADRLVVKPNFVAPDPGMGAHRGDFALFVGRLSPEKGVGTLLAAWERLDGTVPLRIAGDGPLAPQVAEAAARVPGIEWLGAQPPEAIFELLGQARALIFPSEWYEGMSRVGIEAYATGTPIIATKIGTMAEFVRHGQTGFHVRPGDPADLAATVRRAWAEPTLLRDAGAAARAEYEARYTGERNYEQLMAIYERARAGRG